MNLLRRHVDLIVALALAAGYVAEALLDPNPTGPRAANVAAALAVTLPLVWHRRHPLAVTVAIALVSLVQDLFLTSFFDSDATSFLLIIWLVYIGAARTEGVTARWTLGTLLAMNFAAALAQSSSGNAFAAALAPIPLWLAGRGVATRNRLNRELARRSELAGREREAQAALAAAEERVRIAHELQSIVLSEVREIESLARRRSFDAIAVTGRRALDQMRALLGVLREASDAALSETPPVAPDEPPRPASVWLWSATLGRLHGRRQDIAVTLIWAAVLALGSQSSDGTDPGIASAVTAVVMSVAIYWRRRYPALVVAYMLAVAVLSALVFTAETRGVVTLVALFIPLYSAGRINNRLGVVLPLIAGVGVSAMNPISVWSDLLFPPLYLVLAWLFGRMMFNREELAAVLAEEALRVEATRDALAEAAVVGERLRIARDLHDVGAHSLSMIVLQAEAGKRAQGRDPAGADRAADAIAAAASSAVVEVEGLVRGADPLAGLAGLAALCDDARARGLSVDVRVDAPEVPSDIDAVAYRVVQEALTNVVKHAGPTSVSVSVSVVDDSLHVHVADAGAAVRRPASLHGGGHGLAGMRERVEGAGGSLAAGPSEDGFAVTAVLPLRRRGHSLVNGRRIFDAQNLVEGSAPHL